MTGKPPVNNRQAGGFEFTGGKDGFTERDCG